MPRTRIEEMRSYFAELVAGRAERRRRREKEVALLPPDLTGQVHSRAVEEAKRLRDWQERVKLWIPEVEEQIRAAEKEVREACAVAMRPGRYEGDILFGEGQYVPPEPMEGALQVTEEALQIRREKVRPLRRRLKWLRQQEFACQQELGELRRLVLMATTGDVGLIHHLSKKWAGRLEVGGMAEGVAAKISGRYVRESDVTGEPLPPEAIEEDAASMPMDGRAVPR